MLRHLCLFLLMFCLALPATAMPLHCAPVTVHSADHGGMHHGKNDAPVEQTVKHDCIGCIASWASDAPPEATQLAPDATYRPHGDLLLARLTAGPDTPPPRA